MEIVADLVPNSGPFTVLFANKSLNHKEVSY